MKAGGSLREDSPSVRGFTGNARSPGKQSLADSATGREYHAQQRRPHVGKPPTHRRGSPWVVSTDQRDSLREMRTACRRGARAEAETFVCPTCVGDEWGGYAFDGKELSGL